MLGHKTRVKTRQFCVGPQVSSVFVSRFLKGLSFSWSLAEPQQAFLTFVFVLLNLLSRCGSHLLEKLRETQTSQL